MKITVRVKLNSRHKEAVEREGEVFVVYVKSPPIEGRATKRAAELLAEHFDVAKSRVKLVHGTKSRDKVFEVSGG